MDFKSRHLLLLATFFVSLIAVILNQIAANGTSWRWVEITLGSNNAEKNFVSIGFWRQCNYSSKSAPICDQHENSEGIVVISRSVFYVGYVFQILGTVLNLVLFLTSLFNSYITRAWNIDVIMSSTALTFFFLSINIIIFTSILFVSKSWVFVYKFGTIPFEVSLRSFSLFSCLASLFCSQIVIGLIFLSISSNSRESLAAIEPFIRRSTARSRGPIHSSQSVISVPVSEAVDKRKRFSHGKSVSESIIESRASFPKTPLPKISQSQQNTTKKELRTSLKELINCAKVNEVNEEVNEN